MKKRKLKAYELLVYLMVKDKKQKEWLKKFTEVKQDEKE